MLLEMIGALIRLALICLVIVGLPSIVFAFAWEIRDGIRQCDCCGNDRSECDSETVPAFPVS